MKMTKVFIIFILVFALFGCDKDSNIKRTAITDIELFNKLGLTVEEQEYLQGVIDSGTLNIAIRNIPTAYHMENGIISGYHYNLAKYFADNLDVELKIKVVNTSQYFEVNGEVPERARTDPDYSYTPDLFEDVDIYCDTLTPVPWREKLVKFIPFVPIKEMVIHDKKTEIPSLEDLDGMTVSLQQDSSHADTFSDLEEKLGITLNYVYTETISEMLNYVADGKADATIADSDVTIIESTNFDNLKIGIPVTDEQITGWAVQKDNLLMASVLDKYLDYMISCGKFDAYWTEVYDVPFRAYLAFLNVTELDEDGMNLIGKLDLNDEESEYIEKLKDSGVLKVAINDMSDDHNHHLIKNFAEGIDVELEVTKVKIEDYFTKEGYTLDEVKNDLSVSYTPDLIRKVDIYCSDLTILPWREKLIRFIPTLSVKELLITKKENIPESISDLKGEYISTKKGASCEATLRSFENLDFNYIYRNSDNECVEAVKYGSAYATVLNSNTAMWQINKNEDLAIRFAVTDTRTVGWAVKKDDEILASILEKYISYTKITDIFNSYWFKEYGYTYFDYLKSLNVFD